MSPDQYSYFCDICNIGPLNFHNYSYHLYGKSHAFKAGPEAVKENNYIKSQAYRVDYQKYQNGHAPTFVKKTQSGETICSTCNKFWAGEHFPCEICKVCCPCLVSLGQHKAGRSHAEKVEKHGQSNSRGKQTVEPVEERSQLPTYQVPEDKGGLEGFAWVKCKRLGCGFTEVGLEAAAMRHQDKAHSGGHGGGMKFFNIFCRICTHPDNVNLTSEVFDEPSEFYAHMRQFH